MTRNQIDLARYSRIVVLTGAGISVASGLRPFRGPDGLWEELDVERVADAAIVEREPETLWRVFGPLRARLETIEPNPAHRALAAAEGRLRPDQSFTLVTQNIDGLHYRAGSRNVIELHGTIHRTRCANPVCDLEPFEERVTHVGELPRCPRCGAPLRPDIVLFNERIPSEADWHAKRALRDCDLFLAIGTSGTVAPASNFARSADYAGARTILINLEPHPTPNPYFHEFVPGRAEVIVPELIRS